MMIPESSIAGLIKLVFQIGCTESKCFVTIETVSQTIFVQMQHATSISAEEQRIAALRSGIGVSEESSGG